MNFCGATNRAGNPCKRPAGWGTDHVGTGKCKLHGGKGSGRPVEHGLFSRYDAIKRPRIRELLATFEADPDPLNLLPDVKLLRALIVDFIERYDEMTEAILAWHSSFSPSFNVAYANWQTRFMSWQDGWESWQGDFKNYQAEVEQAQSHYRLGWPEPPKIPDMAFPPSPPDPEMFAGKPRQVVDILDVGKFIGQIGALTERIDKQRQSGMISLAAVDTALQQMGMELVKATEETVPDEEQRTRLLASVESRWDSVRLQAGETAR